MWIVPVHHPAFTFRQPNMLGPLEAHVHGFVKRLVEGFPPEPILHENPSVFIFQKFIADVAKARRGIGVDVEAAPPMNGRKEWAVMPQLARLRAFGVGADIGPGVGLSWNYPAPDPVWKLFKKVCEDRKIVKVFANGYAYDIPLLKRYGVIVK